jgi:glycine amidinotransferase/scyllo-inosamine-4-phosphate amidinotransferase 1
VPLHFAIDRADYPTARIKVKYQSRNEWDPLRRVVVGSATGANWPSSDRVFAHESLHSAWKQTPPPSGPVDPTVIKEANQDLDLLADALTDLGVEVVRPEPNDFVATKGMYNYCPRDRLLVADDTVIDVAMMYPCRDQEIQYLTPCLGSMPVIKMPRDQGLVLDAANICRLGDDWLFLRSRSGNEAALTWLRKVLPHKRIHECDFYSGVHIDSTILALREGVVMLNASRVNEDNLPEVLRTWDKIWIKDCVARDFLGYPYASHWIGMNVLSVDPNTVIVDAIQIDIIKTLEARGFDVIPVAMRHSRTLGGGMHCVTLDLWRHHD